MKEEYILYAMKANHEAKKNPTKCIWINTPVGQFKFNPKPGITIGYNNDYTQDVELTITQL